MGALIGPVLQVAIALTQDPKIDQDDDRRMKRSSIANCVQVDVKAGVDRSRPDLGNEFVDQELRARTR